MDHEPITGPARGHRRSSTMARRTDEDQHRIDAERRVEAAVAWLRESAGTEVLDRLGESLEAIAARLPVERQGRAA